MRRRILRGRMRPRWQVGAILAVAAITFAALVARSPVASSADDASEIPSIAAPVSFADVVEKVSPAVVNIAVEKLDSAMPTRIPGGRGTPFDDFFGRFFDMPGTEGKPERRSQALGSGFVVDPDGFIVTNHHVIDGADMVTAIFADGSELPATVVGRDPKTDLALLKVEADSPLPFVEFGDSDLARVGDWVLAIGNPFGLGGSATAGIISARGRDIRSGPYDDYLQIDAPINSGNSGGPVFNGAGEVIGINTAIISPNGGNIGIGFAIPARQAVSVIAELRDHGNVTRGWLGVQIQDLDADLAAALGVDDRSGALVADVVADSPAARGGLRRGDLITRVGGESVDDARHLSRLVAAAHPGDELQIHVLRAGRELNLAVILGNAERSGAIADGSVPEGGSQPGGLSLAPLTAERRAELGLREQTAGVVVAGVEAGSKAASKGIRVGDVVVAIDEREVANVSEAVAALRAAEDRQDPALLLLRRGDAQLYVALSLS
jgi:serine protease Do